MSTVSRSSHHLKQYVCLCVYTWEGRPLSLTNQLKVFPNQPPARLTDINPKPKPHSAFLPLIPGVPFLRSTNGAPQIPSPHSLTGEKWKALNRQPSLANYQPFIKSSSAPLYPLRLQKCTSGCLIDSWILSPPLSGTAILSPKGGFSEGGKQCLPSPG